MLSTDRDCNCRRDTHTHTHTRLYIHYTNTHTKQSLNHSTVSIHSGIHSARKTKQWHEHTESFVTFLPPFRSYAVLMLKKKNIMKTRPKICIMMVIRKVLIKMLCWLQYTFTVKTFGISRISSYADQVCIDLIKNTMKASILWNIMIIKYFLYLYIVKYNLFLWCKAEFSSSFLQSSVSHDPSEIIIICWFAAQETFLIIINVENSLILNYYYCGNHNNFFLFFCFLMNRNFQRTAFKSMIFLQI